MNDQDPEKVVTVLVENFNTIVSEMSNTKSLTIDMKPKDAIKLGIVELDKFQTYSEEEVLPEDGLSWYLYQPVEQHEDQIRQANHC